MRGGAVPSSPPEASELQKSLAGSALSLYAAWLSRKHPAFSLAILEASQVLTTAGFIYKSVIKESNFVQVCMILREGGVLQPVGVACILKDEVNSYWREQNELRPEREEENIQWQAAGETQDYESNLFGDGIDRLSYISGTDDDNLN